MDFYYSPDSKNLLPVDDVDESVAPEQPELKATKRKPTILEEILETRIEDVTEDFRHVAQHGTTVTKEAIKNASSRVKNVKVEVPGLFRRTFLLVSNVVRRGTWKERAGLYAVVYGALWLIHRLLPPNLQEITRLPFTIIKLPLFLALAFTLYVLFKALAEAWNETKVPEKVSTDKRTLRSKLASGFSPVTEMLRGELVDEQ